MMSMKNQELAHFMSKIMLKDKHKLSLRTLKKNKNLVDLRRMLVSKVFKLIEFLELKMLVEKDIHMLKIRHMT